MKHQFFHYLRARGYPTYFLFPLFAQVEFQHRLALLQICFQRLATCQLGLKKSPPVLLKLDDCHFTRELKLSKFLLKPLHELWKKELKLYHIKRGIIYWRNGKNLKSYLCRSRVSVARGRTLQPGSSNHPISLVQYGSIMQPGPSNQLGPYTRLITLPRPNMRNRRLHRASLRPSP